VPVAFHVDYWDYLGWPDPFASPAWTARQRAHAARWRLRSIYTPGFVLDGEEWRNRQFPRVSPAEIGALRLEVRPDKVIASFQSKANEPREYDIHLARLGSGLVSDVTAGENRGRRLTHDFVVLALQKAQLPAGTNRVELLLDASLARPVRALAGWITLAGEAVPIQAAGGWLP
jgi:hypothetical protein